MARKHRWEMTIGKAAESVLRDAQFPVLHYITITREIKHRWPGLIRSETPAQSVNAELHVLIDVGTVRKAFGWGSGRFYLAEKEGELPLAKMQM